MESKNLPARRKSIRTANFNFLWDKMDVNAKRTSAMTAKKKKKLVKDARQMQGCTPLNQSEMLKDQ